MTPGLSPERRLFNAGDRKTVRSEDLIAADLRSGNRITVFETQLPDDKVGWWGHGGYDGDDARTSYVSGDVVKSSDGSSIDGEVYVTITDSDGDPLARRSFSDLEALREAAAEARTDRPAMPAMSPVASSARYLSIEIEAADADDGSTIDPSASSFKMFYTTN